MTMWKPSIFASVFERATSELLVRVRYNVLAMFPVYASNVAYRIYWRDDSARTLKAASGCLDCFVSLEGLPLSAWSAM